MLLWQIIFTKHLAVAWHDMTCCGWKLFGFNLGLLHTMHTVSVWNPDQSGFQTTKLRLVFGSDIVPIIWYPDATKLDHLYHKQCFTYDIKNLAWHPVWLRLVLSHWKLSEIWTPGFQTVLDYEFLDFRHPLYLNGCSGFKVFFIYVPCCKFKFFAIKVSTLKVTPKPITPKTRSKNAVCNGP